VLDVIAARSVKQTHVDGMSMLHSNWIYMAIQDVPKRDSTGTDACTHNTGLCGGAAAALVAAPPGSVHQQAWPHQPRQHTLVQAWHATRHADADLVVPQCRPHACPHGKNLMKQRAPGWAPHPNTQTNTPSCKAAWLSKKPGWHHQLLQAIMLPANCTSQWLLYAGIKHSQLLPGISLTHRRTPCPPQLHW
jgi:hypothetical protein